jgi:putative SOS response-associated peptidase YedK
MCGRYTFFNRKSLKTSFNLENIPEFTPRYNVAPGSLMPVIIKKNHNLALLMKWGLIPEWAKLQSQKIQLINARAESINQKPMFKKLLNSQRCLVPTNGFYEWDKQTKTPFFIHPRDNQLATFAGLYDLWQDAENKPFYSYVIITTAANSAVAKIHPRMPAILDQDAANDWLEFKEVPLEPYAGTAWQIDPVSQAINKPANDNPDLIKSIAL